MANNLVLVVALVAVLAAFATAQPAPAKPVWPTQFDCVFGMSWLKQIVNETSYFYYDYDVCGSRSLVMILLMMLMMLMLVGHVDHQPIDRVSNQLHSRHTGRYGVSMQAVLQCRRYLLFATRRSYQLLLVVPRCWTGSTKLLDGLQLLGCCHGQ
jgi:hypothetical protein